MPITTDQLIFVSYEPYILSDMLKNILSRGATEPGAPVKIAIRFTRKNIQIPAGHESEDFLALPFVFRRHPGRSAQQKHRPLHQGDARIYRGQFKKIKHF